MPLSAVRFPNSSLLGAHHLQEGFDLFLSLLAALAREVPGEHGSGCLGNRTTASCKGNLGQPAVPQVGVDCHLVAAQRVVQVLLEVGVLQLAPIAGALVVVENYLLVEVL